MRHLVPALMLAVTLLLGCTDHHAEPDASTSADANTGGDSALTDSAIVSDANRRDTRPPFDYCFAAGTPVATPDGDRAIETLVVGDAVWAFDSERNVRVQSVVTAVHHHAPASVGRLMTSDGRTLWVTDNHPIYAASRGAVVAAGELTSADALLSLRDDALSLATSQGFEPDVAFVPVFNLTVANVHTYFAAGIAVHNKQPWCAPPAPCSQGYPTACEAEMRLRQSSACPSAAEGFFAIKNTLDVWWPATDLRDPGRGEVEVIALAEMSSGCGEALRPATTLKLCGVTLPVITSDLACEAFQLSFPDSTFDATTMPRPPVPTSLTGFNANDVLRLERTTGLFGISLPASAIDGGWPTPGNAAGLSCDAGSGVLCFPDHDADNAPGLTANVRDDDAIYVGPDYSPTCTQGPQGTPYRFHGVPAQQDPWGAGGGNSRLRAIQLRLGMRLSVGLVGTLSDTCENSATSLADTFDLRSVGCAIEPSSLPQGVPNVIPADPRVASMDYACTPAELSFVDPFLPAFHVLQVDQVPGESQRLAGWALINRDIPKHASLGPQVSIVQMATSLGVEPTCAEVRAALR